VPPPHDSGGAYSGSILTDETLGWRTFAIISRPDAGKTTLTEKLLLFSGAIQLAGEVKAIGLDGGRARARDLSVVAGDELRAQEAGVQPARHTGPPGFQRRTR
jgi:hypothetical protein